MTSYKISASLAIVTLISISGCQSTKTVRYIDIPQVDNHQVPILPPRQPESIGNRRAYFGIHANTCFDRNGKEGAFIVGFYNKSPAKEANLAIGDRITKFGNRTINNAGDLTIAIKYFPPDDAAAISVVRNGVLFPDVFVIGRGYGYPANQGTCGTDKIDESDEISLCKSIGLREVYRPKTQKLPVKC